MSRKMAGQGVVQISWRNDRSPKDLGFAFYLNTILMDFIK